MLRATKPTLMIIIAGYPYFQLNSGMPTKFMPYHPAKSDKGMNTVVTMVRTCIIRFCRMSISD